MPGPPPKPLNIRQRRNKYVTAAELIDTSPLAEGKVPTLRTRRDESGQPIPWPRAVKRWWRDVWTSPMAKEYTLADANGLFMLAVLRERFEVKPTAALAAEIRQQEARFGLDPISRRRLQWQIKREASADSPAAVQARPLDGDDPRARLRAVK